MNKHHGVHMTHCFQGEYPHTCKYGDDDCPARVLENIEVSAAALDKLKAMAQQLQDERDELLAFAGEYVDAWSDGMAGDSFMLINAERLIAKYAAKPEVLE